MKPRAYALTMIAVACLATASGCDNNDTTPFKHVRTSPKLHAFASCETLEAALKENLKQEMRVQLEQMRDIKFFGPEGGDSAVPTSDGGDRQEGVDYSGTNNQEAGVDEADFVKTDGYAVYVLNANALQILSVPVFGQLAQAGSAQIEGYPSQLLLYKETAGGRASRAVVFSSVYGDALADDHPLRQALTSGRTPPPDNASSPYPYAELTKMTVIDLSDMLKPAVVRELYLEGYYQTGRSIESVARMVAYSWMNVPGLRYWPAVPDGYYTTDNQTRRDRLWREAVQEAIEQNNALIEGLTLQDLVPRLYELADEEVIIHDVTERQCADFTIAQDGLSRGFTSLVSFDLRDDASAIDSDHIVSTWSIVYASKDSLLIAEPAQDWWWYWNNDDYDEAVNIHRFALNPDGTAQYTGSGRVDGTIENQFCLSEYNGAIRIAATTGQWNRWWEGNPAPPETHVSVLTQGDNNTLERAGQVGGIAKGERLWAARFVGDKGYLVTFRNTDPLWTVDLSDPAAPRLVGELEVPGVSTYIHPLSGERLLTIGYGGDNESLDGSIQVSLFDVRDFAAPRLIDTLTLFAAEHDNQTSTWGWSEAVGEHKAFQYWAPKRMLAVPLSASRYTYKDGSDAYEYISRLQLVSVDNETGFNLYGSIDHSAFYNDDTRLHYWCNQDIRRSIFMGDFIYALSDRGVTAHALETLTQSAALQLPGTDCGGGLFLLKKRD